MIVWYRRRGKILEFYREDFRLFTFTIYGNKRVNPEKIIRSKDRRIYSISSVKQIPKKEEMKSLL